jgi:hypothetical protein
MLTAAVIARAQKVLAMIGSPNEHERLVAASILRQSAIDSRMTVPEFVEHLVQRPKRVTTPALSYTAKLTVLYRMVLADDMRFSAWERKFVLDVQSKVVSFHERCLTPNRKSTIDNIFRKVAAE